MATYTATQMNAGVLGEVLTGGVNYTFTFNTPAYTSQSVDFNNAQFVVDSSTYTNANLQGSSTNEKVGQLWVGSVLGINTNIVTTLGPETTFSFDVVGGTQGSGAILAVTTNQFVITRAEVTRAGRNYISGDTITISSADLVAAGFTAAFPAAVFDIARPDINGDYISSDLTGTLANFATDVSQSNFISSSRVIAFNIRQDVGSGAGSFTFQPTTTVPVNSYLLKSTGHMDLVIT